MNRWRTGSSVRVTSAQAHTVSTSTADVASARPSSVLTLEEPTTTDGRPSVRDREDDRRSRRSPGPREDRAAPVGRQDLRVTRRSGELFRRREQGPARREAVSGQADRRALRSDVGGGQEQDRLPCPIGDEREPQAVPFRGRTPRPRQRHDGEPVGGQEVDRTARRCGPGGDHRGDDAAVLDQVLQRGGHVARIETEVHRLDLDRPGPMRGELQPRERRCGHELGIRRRSVEEESDGGDVGSPTRSTDPSEQAGTARARRTTRPARMLRSARPLRPATLDRPGRDGGIGRRAGLKNPWASAREGSTPSPGTLHPSSGPVRHLPIVRDYRRRRGARPRVA